MAQLLLGKPVVAAMAEDLSARTFALQSTGIDPALALVRVGDRPDDLSYERTVIKRAESLGVGVRHFVLDENASQENLEVTLDRVNAEASIHGCLLFRPLPSCMNEQEICNRQAIEKDIDGTSDLSLAAVFTDSDAGFAPCTAQACLTMLDFYEIPIAGKHVVVIGRSLVIGKPVAMMLLRRNATVTVCHSKTENLPEVSRGADIVICATGRARAFGAEYFSEGQVVLDVGINFDEEGNLCGDVDFASVEPKVAAITPVPGGLGSVTTSVTLEHTIVAAERTCQNISC